MAVTPPPPVDPLAADTENLGPAVRAGQLRAARFRDELVGRVVQTLEGGHSVLLVGPGGVGKSAIVHAAALTGTRYQSIRSLSTATFLIGTKFLGELPTRVAKLAAAAIAQKAVLHITDVLNLRSAGTSNNDPTTVMDQLKPDVAAGRLLLIGEVTKEERDRLALARGLFDLFEVIEVPPLPAADVEALIEDEARTLKLHLAPGAHAELLALPARFLPSRAPPSGALELLEHVARYHREKVAKGEPEPVDAAFVGKVFSIISGLPRFVVMRSETRPAKEVRAWFSERVVGQREAIDAVVETITLFKAGLHDPDRAIGTFLFVGPTGVGKTELARRLAEYLFGSAQRLLRFDLSEFTEYDSPQRLIGDLKHPEQPARLIDPVRTQPFQVVLLDEVDKAHSNVWDLLLPLLDDGRLTSAFGETIDFRGTLIIATCNTGSVEGSKGLGFGHAPEEGEVDSAKLRKVLERTFRPELLNRFGHIAIFKTLSRAELRLVARREVEKVIAREGIVQNRLVVDVTDAALDHVLIRGYDPKYGARALKREVQRTLAVPLALTLMERTVEAGALLRVDAVDGAMQVRVMETKDSRKSRREKAPVRTADGEKLTLPGLHARMQAIETGLDALLAGVGSTDLKERFEALSAQRFQPGFWKEPARAVAIEAELDRISICLARTHPLREEANALEQTLRGNPGRGALEGLARGVGKFEQHLARVRRELLSLGLAGSRDALVRVRPIGGSGRGARDRLLALYRAWAKHRSHDLDVFFEPLEDNDPVCFAVYGPYAFGHLYGERGLHRVADGDGTASVAEVQVTPLGAPPVEGTLKSVRALKQTGQLGGPVRSRIVLEASGPNGPVQGVLQGHRTVAQAKEVAGELLASWLQADAVPGEVIRGEGEVPGSPEQLQALLEEQIDRRASGYKAPVPRDD